MNCYEYAFNDRKIVQAPRHRFFHVQIPVDWPCPIMTTSAARYSKIGIIRTLYPYFRPAGIPSITCESASQASFSSFPKLDYNGGIINKG